MHALEGKAKELYDRFCAVSADLSDMENALQSGKYSAEDVSMAATAYTEYIAWKNMEILSHLEDTEQRRLVPGEYIPNICGSNLPDMIELLLHYGLNPNAVYADENIMENLMYLDNGYVAADCLNLLLQHGGDPYLSCGGECLFNSWDFNVIFDACNQEDRHRYDSLVHGWFVLLGYVGELAEQSGKEPPVHVYRKYNSGELFRLSDLKDHRSFTFGLSHTPYNGESWSLHIFDKRTLWEVARL